jgi:hypothetical protein
MSSQTYPLMKTEQDTIMTEMYIVKMGDKRKHALCCMRMNSSRYCAALMVFRTYVKRSRYEKENRVLD